jgi:hypothetical protein
MRATILLLGRCPVCGYRNQGVQVGTARPAMRSLFLDLLAAAGYRVTETPKVAITLPPPED